MLIFEAMSGNSLMFTNVFRPTTTLMDVWARNLQMSNVPVVANLSSGVESSAFSVAAGAWSYFRVSVPTGTSSLTISTTATGSGNANLYGYIGNVPTTTRYDIASRNSGNTESILVQNPPAGIWYFGVYGATAASGVKILAAHQ